MRFLCRPTKFCLYADNIQNNLITLDFKLSPKKLILFEQKVIIWIVVYQNYEFGETG